jgi:hypothetical protein
MFHVSDIDSLPDDPIDACMLISRKILDIYGKTSSEEDQALLGDYIQAYAFLSTCLKATPFNTPPLRGSRDQYIGLIIDAVKNVLAKLESEHVNKTSASLESVLKTKFGFGFYYEFTDGDLKSIQVKLNQMRDMITCSEYLDEDMRSRLLHRLEALQSELHKRMSAWIAFGGFWEMQA